MITKLFLISFLLVYQISNIKQKLIQTNNNQSTTNQSILDIDQQIYQSENESKKLANQLANTQEFDSSLIIKFKQMADEIDDVQKNIRKQQNEFRKQMIKEQKEFMIGQQKKHWQFIDEQLKNKRMSQKKHTDRGLSNNQKRRLSDDEDDDDDEYEKKQLEAKIKAEAEARQMEVDKLKKERDDDKKAKDQMEKQLEKVEQELEKSKTIFINSYDNQKKFIDSTEKHSQLLINQLGLMSQQIVDSEDRRDEESRRKEEIEMRKEFEKRIRDQMDRSMELQQKASEKVHGIEQMKNQVNALIQSMKYSVQRNKNLESRVISLESIINAERSRRQITEGKKPSLSELEEECSQKYSCESCSKDPQCGWCMSEQLCKAGDPVGPLMGSCVYWDYNGCSQGVCQGNSRCKGCIVNQECGWCEATKTCSEGSRVKPLMSCPFGYLHQDMKQPCDPDQKDLEQYILQDQSK